MRGGTSVASLSTMASIKTHCRIQPELENKLNHLLANEVTLYFKTKKAHWLASGPWFREIHEMLDDHAQFLVKSIDSVAERITLLSGTPLASLAEFKAESFSRDFQPEPQPLIHLLEALFEDQERAAVIIREIAALSDEQGDLGTTDLLGKLVRNHEMAAWFLRQTLRKEEFFEEAVRPEKKLRTKAA